MTTNLIPAFVAACGLVFLAACGGGGGSGPTVSQTPTPTPQPPPSPTPTPDPPPVDPTTRPFHHLETARFTTHQPGVLEQIGAHHAYARGLSGQGVRIGIDDTIIDYTQTAEFGNRVKLRDADGAVLSYWRPLGDLLGSEIDTCSIRGSCSIWEGNSDGDDEALNRWVRHIVSEDGWPTRDDSTFILDQYYAADGSVGQLYRWSELPTPYGAGRHGTAVASVAAGNSLGVAPAATIIPIARNLTPDQAETTAAEQLLQNWIQGLPSDVRARLDDDLAAYVRGYISNFDIINRSYGARLELAGAYTAEQVGWYRTWLPKTLRAEWQVGRPDAEKTVIVYAAGNQRRDQTAPDPFPALGALLPYYISELRGHHLAVAATDPGTGYIADYSYRCGPLPRDWNPSRHGRHYCLAAPGTVRGLVPDPNRPGRGSSSSGIRGTSFAAPLVSGSLALLMEHFRGTRGNTEIVKRMLDTADRSGIYANSVIYGAGHLDLEAALSPVGVLTASGHPLSHTSFSAPAAYGNVGQRVGSMELASFDAQGFPFWIPVGALVSTGGASRSPIPQFETAAATDTPAPGMDALNLAWTPVAGEGSALLGDRWVMGFGETSAGIALRPDDNGFGYGASFDNAGHLEAETSGAFGTDPRSGMLWTSRSFAHELGGSWAVKATGTAALNLPQYERDGIFRASPSVMSAASVRIGTEATGLVIEQPLRAESGTGTFRLETGHVTNGKRAYDEYRVPLRPDGREVRMTLRHDFAALGGTIAMEVGGAVNAGHVPDRRETNVGLAYRATW